MKPKPAPATPAATPPREANQQQVDAAAQRVRESLTCLPTDHEFRKDVELLIEIALAPVLEIFAPAQPVATPMETMNQRASVDLADEADARDAIADAIIKNAIHVAALQPAAAQPQRESEQPEQALRNLARSWLIRYDRDEVELTEDSLIDLMRRAEFPPQTDSQEQR